MPVSPARWHSAPARWRQAEPAKPASELKALRGLPPLLKGYLRLGAYVCEDAVIDYQFGTTDVFLVLPSERISARYINFYGADASRHAAA